MDNTRSERREEKELDDKSKREVKMDCFFKGEGSLMESVGDKTDNTCNR